LKYLISNKNHNLKSSEKIDWSRYILSLIFRRPSSVEDFRKAIRQIFAEILEDEQSNYAKVRRPADPASILEYEERQDPIGREEMRADALKQLINNSKAIEAIVKMNWCALNISGSTKELLCSDHPVYRPFGLNDRSAHIVLPIAPDTIFLAARRPEAGKMLLKQYGRNNLCKMINKNTVEQATEFVWGSDDAQLPFVKKHMGRKSKRDTFSHQLLQDAIGAASRQHKDAQ
jgi:hypothetical protein